MNSIILALHIIGGICLLCFLAILVATVIIFIKMLILAYKNKKQTQAEWLYHDTDVNDMTIYKCSKCGRKQFGTSKYCASCGSLMEE